jgi:arginine repressor
VGLREVRGWLYLKYPLRNLIVEKINEAGTLTDLDLMTNLEKEDIEITESDMNKILLDLEIFGLIRVSWISKDKRRIEAVSKSKEENN